MFIGREKELEALEKRYRSDHFEFPVIYGRRRIGKTRLIQEFIREKKAIYFMATEQSEKEQLKSLTAAIREQYPDEQTKLIDRFSGFESLFSYMTQISKDRRIILAIDEYPYLAKAVPSISSLLQKFIDQEWSHTKLYLILCGSSMSFMERQVLQYKSPLYGRRTAQLKLHPLPWYESIRFFPEWQAEEKLLAYGICGGIPQYLSYFSFHKNLEEAVVEEFLSTDGHLQEEPENLMLQELREPAVYNSLLSAIANGASRLNDIAMAMGRDPGKITFYLNNLMDLELVEKIQPVESKGTRCSIYRIRDELYLFWYRFIPSCASLIAMGLGRAAWEKHVLPHLSEYFGHIFEEISMQYIQRLIMTGNMNELYTTYGHWWGTNPVRKREEEIDIVCANETDILCGECKWRSEPAGMDVLEILKERSLLISKGRKIHYALFSKSGFTESLQKEAESGNILLVDTEKLLAIQ